MAAQTTWFGSTDTQAVRNNLSQNNSSGFSALPGGYRFHFGGYFGRLNWYGGWWSATESDDMELAMYAWSRELYYVSTGLLRELYHKRTGLSIRLVKSMVAP